MLVGSDEQAFLVHTEYICKTSKFFAAACSNGWKEDRERTIRLPEVGPHLFQAYLHWVYTMEIELELPEPYKEGTHRARDVQAKLLEFYILADFVKDVRLRNQIMRRFAESLGGPDCGPTVSIYVNAFEQLPPYSSQSRNRASGEVPLLALSSSHLDLHLGLEEHGGECLSEVTVEGQDHHVRRSGELQEEHQQVYGRVCARGRCYPAWTGEVHA